MAASRTKARTGRRRCKRRVAKQPALLAALAPSRPGPAARLLHRGTTKRPALLAALLPKRPSPARRVLRSAKRSPWKLVGLAGIAGVAATGVVVARNRRTPSELAPDELRARLRTRLTEAGGGAEQPPSPPA